MQTSLRVKLSIFMFLQYFIWGSWYVSMATYLGKTLGFEGGQIGLAYGAFAVGAMISPFFVGLIADRYFASESLLGVLGIGGGLLLFVLPRLTSFSTFYPVLILYCATYAPTLALGNSLSLHHLKNSKRDFPLVKTLSAVGWIAGGVTLSLVLKGEQSAVQFYLAGGVSIALGLFAWFVIPAGVIGASGAIFAVIGIALLLLPSARLHVGCLAIFPFTVLLALFRRPEQPWQWAIRWTDFRVSMLWCLLLVPFLEVWGLIWSGWNWTNLGHLLGLVAGVVCVLLLPQRISMRRPAPAL